MVQIDRDDVRIQCDRPQGILPASTTVDITITLTVYVRQQVNFPLYFRVLGSSEPPLSVAIGCIGEGAVVSVSPASINLGKIPVLQQCSRDITLTNESLIPATYHCTLLPANSPFSVQSASNVIAANQSQTLTIHVCLKDCTTSSAELQISYDDDTPTQVVTLQAHGVGSTVVPIPDIRNVAFGDQFSLFECSQTFVLKNSGLRPQRVVFALDAPPPTAKGDVTVMRGAEFKKTRTPTCPNPPDAKRSVFGVWPEQLLLNPGQEATFSLKGFSKQVQVRSSNLPVLYSLSCVYARGDQS
jgi:hydrocephalus-inducing protein